jgi:hypothetical protein
MLTGLPGFVFRDFSKGDDHLSLNAGGFIRFLLNQGSVFHQIGKEVGHQEQDDGDDGIVQQQNENKQGILPDSRSGFKRERLFTADQPEKHALENAGEEEQNAKRNSRDGTADCRRISGFHLSESGKVQKQAVNRILAEQPVQMRNGIRVKQGSKGSQDTGNGKENENKFSDIADESECFPETADIDSGIGEFIHR